VIKNKAKKARKINFSFKTFIIKYYE